MKSLFAAFCLAGTLGMTAPAMAAMQTFGPDAARFTIDIPEGWTATPRDDGCQVTSSDGNSSLVVQFRGSGGRSSAELARDIGADILKKNPGSKLLDSKDIGPGQTLMTCEVDNVRTELMVMVDGDNCCVFTVVGADFDGMLDIIRTIRDAKQPSDK